VSLTFTASRIYEWTVRAEDQAWRPVALFGGLTNEYGYLWNGTERLTNGQKLTLSQFNLVYETQQTFNE